MEAIENKMLLYCFVISIYIGCTFSENQNPTKIELVEAQVLCVYWSPSFEARDTLSAINFVVKAEQLYANTQFYFEFPFDGSNKEIKLIKRTILKNEHEVVIGLVLISRDIYELFPDDIFAPGGPCYEKELSNMLGQGKLFIMDKGPDHRGRKIQIGKSSDFHFTIGLKD